MALKVGVAMSTAINSLISVVMIFCLTFVLFDINTASQMKQIIYENSRATGQNSLLELQSKINKNDIITSSMMLERWLVNFIDNNVTNIKQLEINFVKVATEPQLYLVRIKGYSSAYVFLTENAYNEYTVGTTIIVE